MTQQQHQLHQGNDQVQNAEHKIHGITPFVFFDVRDCKGGGIMINWMREERGLAPPPLIEEPVKDQASKNQDFLD